MVSQVTADQRSCWLQCVCGHNASEHYDDGNGGFATCSQDNCDCEWYVGDQEDDEPIDDATRYALGAM